MQKDLNVREATVDIHVDPISGISLVHIFGGKFTMGAPDDEIGRNSTEGPLHEVHVNAFHIAQYPITNEQYARFLEAVADSQEPLFWNDAAFNQPTQPVVGVSWEDARAYCAWAGLRLPSEAEWEFACRAGTTSRFWSGDADDDLSRVGWYDKNSDLRLHTVGEKEPNPLGLFDMHGNVWEWVEDDWLGNYSNAPSEGSRSAQVERSAVRVYRGGAFNTNAASCRSASRGYWYPGMRNNNLGFRPATSIL
jgi:formylglycine-generating enzyme required for sulfatase activity